MPLLSVRFALLTAATALLTRLVPGKYRCGVVLCASLLFYGSCGAAAFCGMAADVLLCFFAAWGIETLQKAKKRPAARAVLLAASAAQCGLLVGFRGQWLGLSYVSLILLSYLIDVFRRKAPAQKNPALFFSYAMFFPQMTQGPISRYGELLPQLEAGAPARWEDLCAGLKRILLGLLKKVVLAARLSLLVSAAYGAPETFTGGALWVAALAYAVEIYADFSGCMDIVLGAARLFGIRLPENFKRPYLAASMEEYWKRWHSTMGAWFREYVFYPLAVSNKMIKVGQKLAKRRIGAAAKRAAVVVLPLMTTWLLTGLWHGSTWHYALWGLANGGVILLEACRKNRVAPQGGKRVVCIAATFFMTMLIRVLFCAESVSSALTVYGRMLGVAAEGNGVFSCGWSAGDGWVCIAGGALLLGADVWKEYHFRKGKSEKSLPGWARWALGLAGVFALMIFGRYGPGYDPSEFFYSKF